MLSVCLSVCARHFPNINAQGIRHTYLMLIKVQPFDSEREERETFYGSVLTDSKKYDILLLHSFIQLLRIHLDSWWGY